MASFANKAWADETVCRVTVEMKWQRFEYITEYIHKLTQANLKTYASKFENVSVVNRFAEIIV